MSMDGKLALPELEPAFSRDQTESELRSAIRTAWIGLAMTFGIAGLIARGETHIQDADCVDISFPTFWQELEKLRVQA